MKIEIEDYYVMLNLHKALLEAKFHKNPDNKYVCGSPIIAELHNNIIDVLSKIDEAKDKNNVGKWDNWRLLKNQCFYRQRALENALLIDRWRTMTFEEKVNISKNLLSPFIATQYEIVEFVNDVEQLLINQDS